MQTAQVNGWMSFPKPVLESLQVERNTLPPANNKVITVWIESRFQIVAQASASSIYSSTCWINLVGFQSVFRDFRIFNQVPFLLLSSPGLHVQWIGVWGRGRGYKPKKRCWVTTGQASSGAGCLPNPPKLLLLLSTFLCLEFSNCA